MGDVIDLHKKRVALFNEQQKERMSNSIKDLTAEPDLAVDRIEQNLCVQLAETTREVASSLAERFGAWLSKRIFG